MSFSIKNIDERCDELDITIIGTTDDYPAKFKAANTLFQNNLYQKNISLAYISLGNTAVPLFIPKKLNELPSFITSLNTYYPVTNYISINSIDYIFAFNSAPNLTGAGYGLAQWVQPDPTIQAPYYILNQGQVIQNKYYYAYRVTHILAIFIQTLNQTVLGVSGTLPPTGSIGINYNPSAKVFSLFISQAIFDATIKFLMINQNLKNLFRFNNFAVGNDFYVLVNDSIKNVNGIDCYVFNSEYISANWTAFDTVEIGTTLPIKAVEFQSNVANTSESSTDHKKILFSLNTTSSGLSIYPNYQYEATTTDFFKSFSQDSWDQSTFEIELFLSNKLNKVSIEYKLNKDDIITIILLVKKIGQKQL